MLVEGEHLDHPYGLAHSGNFVFWTEFQKGHVLRWDALTGNISRLKTENPPLFELRFFDEASQSGKSPSRSGRPSLLSTPLGRSPQSL